MSFLALTFWIMFSLLLFSSDPVLSYLPPVLSDLALLSNARTGKQHELWVMSNLLRISLSLCVSLSICPVSPTKRWCRGPGRGSLFLSLCQCLGSASQPGFGSGPGPACLIGAPGGEKRGHPPTSWSQMQKVLFLRLILRRLNLWTVDMDGIYEREKQKAERGGNDWNFITVNLLFIYRIIRADRNCDGAHGFTKDPWYERPRRPLSDWVTKKTRRTEAAHVRDFCTFLTKGGREGGEWTTQLKEGKAGLAEKKLLQREKEWAWSKCHIVRWEKKKESFFFFALGLELVLDLIFSWMNRPHI